VEISRIKKLDNFIGNIATSKRKRTWSAFINLQNSTRILHKFHL